MTKYILLCVFFTLGMSIPQEVLVAKEFHYPGQELNGTWQVVKHNYWGVEDVNAPYVKEFFNNPSNDFLNSMFLLPDGQKIGFWLTGDGHMISPLQHPRSGMDIGMKLIFPLDKRLCNSGAWDFLCDKNGNIKPEKKDPKENSYTIATEGQGMLNPDFLSKQQLAHMKARWPNIKNYSYNINLGDGLFNFDIYPMKNNNDILIAIPLPSKGAWAGVLLKRVK